MVIRANKATRMTGASVQTVANSQVMADSTTSPNCLVANPITIPSSLASLQWNGSLSTLSPLYAPNYYTITSSAFTQIARIIFNTGIE